MGSWMGVGSLSTADDVRSALHRLIDALPAGDLAELARIAERLRRRRDRRARLEWVSEYVRRLPAEQRAEAWTSLLWLVGETPVGATALDRLALREGPSDAVSWAEAKREMGL